MQQNKIFYNNTNDIRLSAQVQSDSVVDGPGLRTVIWTQGCIHNCEQCHNPETHDFNGGQLVPVGFVTYEVLKRKQNITFSGGDPFLQPKQCASIASCAKHNGLNVWAYSGFTYEQLVSFNNPDIDNFLDNIDVLVDGKFDIKQKSLDCQYRGSTNQRLIDVKKTKELGKVVLWEDPFDSIKITHNPFM